MKRIFSFLLCLFLIFQYFTGASYASTTSTDCSISIIKPQTPLVAGSTALTIQITSNGNLNPGEHKVAIDGDSTQSTPYIVDQGFDKSGNSTVTETVNLVKGTFNIYVGPENSGWSILTFDPSKAECASTQISVNEQASGSNCTPSISSSDTNNYFSTSDNLTLQAKFLDGTDPNDSHRVIMYDSNNNKVSLGGVDPCPTTAQLESGFPLTGPGPSGSFDAGNYYITINNGSCTQTNVLESNACTTPIIQITAAGVTDSSPIQGNTDLCYSCPSGYTYADTGGSQTCTSSSGTIPAKNNGYCDLSQGQTCDNVNHIFGCNGSTGGGGAAALPTPPPNPPPCAGACSSIQTGLGINLPTDAVGFATAIMGLVLAIGGLIALLIIIITGYRILTSQGDPEKIKGARESITAAIAGLLFIIFSLAILSFIGVSVIHIPGFGTASNASIRINGDKPDCGPQGC